MLTTEENDVTEIYLLKFNLDFQVKEIRFCDCFIDVSCLLTRKLCGVRDGRRIRILFWIF